MSKLNQRDKLSIKQKLDDAWRRSASPLLLHTKKKQPEQVFSKKGNPLTKNQIRAKKKMLKRKHKKGERKQHPSNKNKVSRPTYAVYILSRTWRARCRSFYAKYGKKCVACGSTINIHLHHMSYRHLGNEEDGELAPLCRDCHREYHELNGVQSNMIKATVAFIEEKRQLLSL